MCVEKSRASFTTKDEHKNNSFFFLAIIIFKAFSFIVVDFSMDFLRIPVVVACLFSVGLKTIVFAHTTLPHS